MSRAAVFDALVGDVELNSIVPSANVFPNYSRDESPGRGEPFIILRWGPDEVPKFDRGNHTRDCTVWAHLPNELGSDFTLLDTILERVQEILEGLEHAPGSDGYTVTNIKWQGSGSDNQDDGYSTTSRNAIFTMLSRRS